MNKKMVGHIIAYILFIEAILMLPAMAISFARSEITSVRSFFFTILIILGVAASLYYLTRDAKRNEFYAREGLAVTGLSWIFMSLLGCIPFYMSGAIPSFVDAFFETVSGFTTTGSSILHDVEAMDHGLLWWRSFTHWVGGMGVLVFLMAIVSLGGRNQGFTLHILRAESPGPSVGKMVPRMKRTAMILYLIYIGLTLLDIIFLLLGGMSLFEACCTAFGTAGTGGFGVRNDSISGYSPYIQVVTTIFMFAFSINFSIYYLILLRRFKDVFRDEELRFFLISIVVFITLISLSIYHIYGSLSETLIHSAFTVGTMLSTTGFATTDFGAWPTFAKGIILIMMIVGACAGSTGGGLKQMRVILLLKNLRRNIYKSLHPSEVKTVMVNNRPVDEAIINNTNTYLIAYCLIIIVSFLFVSLDGFDIETTLSAILATFNNIGPGLSVVGPTYNYADFSNLSKIVMSIDMLAGRLEIYPILILCTQRAWRRAR